MSRFGPSRRRYRGAAAPLRLEQLEDRLLLWAEGDIFSPANCPGEYNASGGHGSITVPDDVWIAGTTHTITVNADPVVWGYPLPYHRSQIVVSQGYSGASFSQILLNGEPPPGSYNTIGLVPYGYYVDKLYSRAGVTLPNPTTQSTVGLMDYVQPGSYTFQFTVDPRSPDSLARVERCISPPGPDFFLVSGTWVWISGLSTEDGGIWSAAVPLKILANHPKQTVTTNATEAHPGDQITYNVTATSDADADSFHVVQYVPYFCDVTDAGGGTFYPASQPQYGGGRVEWNLSGGKLASAHFSVRLWDSDQIPDYYTTFSSMIGSSTVRVLGEDLNLRGSDLDLQLKRSDLAVALSAQTPSGDGTIGPGQTISYTVSATPSAGATDVQLTIPTPPGTQLYQNGLPVSQVTFHSDGSAILGNFTAIVKDRAHLPAGLTSIVATAHGTATVNGNAAQADDSATVDIALPKLDLTLQVNKQQAAPEDTLTYTLTATSETAVGSFTLTADIPEGTDLISKTKGAKTSSPAKGEKRLTWKMPGGTTAQVTYTVRVQTAAKLPKDLSQIHAQASVQAVIAGETNTTDKTADTPLVTPDFDWSMPDRYWIDTNDNDLIDLPNSSDYVNPADGFHVILDAGSIDCPVPFTDCTWTLSGVKGQFTGQKVEVDHLKNEKTYTVKLVAKAQDGSTLKVTKKIAVRDVLVAAIGDSYSSGEGNPDLAGAPGRWADGLTASMNAQNAEAHRSTSAASSLAAKALEQSDKHFSVTFVFLSASGSTIKEGLLGTKDGCENPVVQVPAQIPQLKSIIGKRKIDILTLSIGGNDVGFSDIVQQLLVPVDLLVPFTWEASYLQSIDDKVTPALKKLATGYRDLVKTIRSQLAPRNVIQTEYPDFACDSTGASAFFADDMVPGCSITPSRGEWARNNILQPLNLLIRKSTASNKSNHWTFGGSLAAFTTHGYAALDPWFVTMTVAKATQGVQFRAVNIPLPNGFDGGLATWGNYGIDISLGALHPNAAGHAAIATAMQPAIDAILPTLPAMPDKTK